VSCHSNALYVETENEGNMTEIEGDDEWANMTETENDR